VCCQFVNKGLAPAGCVFFLVFIFAYLSRHRQEVSLYGCMCIDVLIVVYCLYDLIFSADNK
jgi:hypothetical protein